MGGRFRYGSKGQVNYNSVAVACQQFVRPARTHPVTTEAAGKEGLERSLTCETPETMTTAFQCG